ncbi:MAG: hypothetical protein IT304_01835 [Dehalococcoidia bacterium]|nr:hypothetical protein [Dehalococcoidia bacterium]
MNLRILSSLLPVAVFFGLSRVAPAWAAILGGFAVSAMVFGLNRRQRLIGGLTAFGFGVVAVSAVVGIAWQSEKAYLASGPVSDFLFVPLYLVSVQLRQPLVGGIARQLVPAIAGHLRPDAALFAWLTVVWAVFDALHGAVRMVLLAQLSVGEYIVWSRVVGMPLTGALLALSGLLIYREARRRGGPPLRQIMTGAEV